MNYIKTYEDYIFESQLEDIFMNEADDDDKKSTDRSPIDNEAIETGLKKKSDETGVPIGIIRAVMRRGMAAWKSGHRPGAGQEQWGYARVNSFLTKGKGTWGKADADLAKEVRDGGHDPMKKNEGRGYFAGISKSTEMKKKAQMAKQATMDDDDPNAYKEMPGDTKGKKQLKTSTHTKKYHELFGESVSKGRTVITATGLEKMNKEDLIKLGVEVKQVGPGFYLTFDDKDKTKVMDYLNKHMDIEISK